MIGFQHFTDSGRCTGPYRRIAQYYSADVQGMKYIYILFRRNSFNNSLFIHLFRERQLDKNPVNTAVSVQFVEDTEQHLFR